MPLDVPHHRWPRRLLERHARFGHDPDEARAIERAAAILDRCPTGDAVRAFGLNPDRSVPLDWDAMTREDLDRAIWTAWHYSRREVPAAADAVRFAEAGLRLVGDRVRAR